MMLKRVFKTIIILINANVNKNHVDNIYSVLILNESVHKPTQYQIGFA